jgi:hypothetical protein
MHCTPVHGAWLNQVEHWCSMRPRPRLRIADVDSKAHLQAKLGPCMREGNQPAHPCNGLTKSVAKVMADVPAMAA